MCFSSRNLKKDGGAGLRTEISRAEHKQLLGRASDKLRRK
jgi:hypothetical protein